MASVGIVGAGLSGLATALAIARTHCHEVSVYEANQIGVPAAVPLHLPPNATRVCKAMGVEPALLAQAHHAQRQQVRTGTQGFQLAELPLGDLALARYNAPYLTLQQDGLSQLLVAALAAEAVALNSNHCCTQVDAQLGKLQFSNASSVEHDLLVIADGANSTLRAQLGYNLQPEPNGQQLTLGILGPEAELAQQLSSGLNQWLGPNRWFSHWPVDEQGRIGFAAVSEANQNPAQLAERFADWHPLVASIIREAKQLHSEPLSYWQPLPEWLQGKAVLLGDAAHPVLPFTDQSAALGIEDAWVLSRMLEQQEQQPLSAAAEYQRYRLRRCTRVQQFAQSAARDLQTADPSSKFKRNIKLSLGSRFLPEWALAKFDWLYGYDCVRGFH